MDEETDVGEEMVREMGIDPAMDVDDNQRAELLRQWHREDGEKAQERKTHDKR